MEKNQCDFNAYHKKLRSFSSSKREERKHGKKETDEPPFELGSNWRSSRREHSARSRRGSAAYDARERRCRLRHRREWNDNGVGKGPSSSRESIFRATSCVRSHVARDVVKWKVAAPTGGQERGRERKRGEGREKKKRRKEKKRKTEKEKEKEKKSEIRERRKG